MVKRRESSAGSPQGNLLERPACVRAESKVRDGARTHKCWVQQFLKRPSNKTHQNGVKLLEQETLKESTGA